MHLALLRTVQAPNLLQKSELFEAKPAVRVSVPPPGPDTLVSPQASARSCGAGSVWERAALSLLMESWSLRCEHGGVRAVSEGLVLRAFSSLSTLLFLVEN